MNGVASTRSEAQHERSRNFAALSTSTPVKAPIVTLPKTLRPLERMARASSRRLRLQQGLGRFAWLLPLPLLYALGYLTYVKAARAAFEPVWVTLGIALLSAPLAGGLSAFFGRRPRWEGSLALDQRHDAKDRVTNALCFAELPQSERSSLVEAAIEDGVAFAERSKPRPRRAVPLHLPRELWLSVALMAALAAIAGLEVRVERLVPPPAAENALMLAPDDVELFRDLADELDKKAKDPDVQASVGRFNQLLEDVAERRLDRAEVFRRLAKLEQELSKSLEADRAELEQAMTELAGELKKSDLAKPAGKALEQKQLADAEAALKQLAERLRKKGAPPTPAELDRLRKALEKASKTSEGRVLRLEQQRERAAKRRRQLLKKKQDGKELSNAEQRELESLERRLERLDRDTNRARRARQELSQLDKELAQAAKELMQNMGAQDMNRSAEHLERGAQDLNRMAGEKLSDEQKRELLQRMKQLSEVLRQGGKGGQERMRQLMRFAKRARGGRPQPGQGGEKAEGKGRLVPFGAARSLDGPLVLGPAGMGTPLPGPGQSGAGQPKGGGADGESGSGPGGGKDFGTGHDPNVKGEASSLRGQTQDVTAVAADTGEGTASAEVIYGAAEQGFVGRGYRDVYTDYRTVAERVLERDEVPPGYRFYVQRYFQLIRPRE